MKVFTEDAVYVQKKDVLELNKLGISIPTSVVIKKAKYFNVLEDESFFKFDNQDEIDYFRRLRFIVDYDEIKSLTDEELAVMFKNTLNKKKKVFFYEERKILDIKIRSLCDYILYRAGVVYIDFPNVIKNEVKINKKDSTK